MFYMRKALLVSGLSPSNWRMRTSEADPLWASTSNMASDRRIRWEELTGADGFSPFVFDFQLSELETKLLEPPDKHDEPSVVSDELPDTTKDFCSTLEFFRQSEIHNVLDLLFLTTCRQIQKLISKKARLWDHIDL